MLARHRRNATLRRPTKLDGAPRDAAASFRLEPTVQEGTSRGESGLPLFQAAMHNIAYWSVPAAVAV
jgi:hypothetical protein